MSTTTQDLPVESRHSFARGFGRRLELSGLSLVYVILALPALALLCIMTTAWASS